MKWKVVPLFCTNRSKRNVLHYSDVYSKANSNPVKDGEQFIPILHFLSVLAAVPVCRVIYLSACICLPCHPPSLFSSGWRRWSGGGGGDLCLDLGWTTVAAVVGALLCGCFCCGSMHRDHQNTGRKAAHRRTLEPLSFRYNESNSRGPAKR